MKVGGYLKISLTTNYGEYIESVPFVVTKTEGDYSVDFLDSDGDGLPDVYEITLGTDINNVDSDDDGLTDYQEVYITGTNPTVYDSVTEGVSDAEYKVEQTISVDSDVLADINTVENAYELFIDIKTNGYAEKEVTVSKSSYSYAIENDAMIGLSADIFISDTCNPEEIVLKYDIKEAYIDNTLNLYSGLEEFQGIKRLNVFKFDEDKNMLLPVETEFDVENGLLYAEVDELGTYCIMDMEIWLNNLGVEMPKESQNEENAMYLNSPSIMSASEDSDSVWTPTYINAPIDLVFMIDSDGNYKYEFETEKSLIANICDFAFVCYKDVRVHIISCTCSSSNVLKSSNGKSWFENRNEVQKALNSIQYTNCNSNSEKNDQFNTLINGVEFQDNSDRFIYKFHNHGNSRTSYDRISSLDFCRMKLGIYSEISPVNWYYPDSQYEITLKKEITDNNGLFIEIDSNTLTAIAENIANNLSYVRPVYEIIIPNKWKKIYLDGELSPDNDIDTDKDTLTDWEEVDTARLIWNEDGSFDIPTFNISELICHLVRFQSDDYYFIVHNSTPHCYLPILSDPTSINSDGDALEDSKDIDPLYLDPNPISYSNILSIEYKYIPLQEIDSIAGWIGRRLSKKWDCNVYVSIIKSCICEEDIFCIFTENLELSEAYPITNDLIKELTNAEKEYQNNIYHVKNENAAHAGKLETDQLVPNYFDKNSSYYYGCWYHNYYHELYMSGYYSEKIDMASKAFLVYTAVLGMYQSKILASEQKAIQLSREEYSNAAKQTIVKNYSEEEIQSILENIKETGIKNNPLRQAYENEVRKLSSYGEKLSVEGYSESEIAKILNEERRNLGIKYKDMTPQPLRDYIYEVNMGRYGDKLGPTYEYLKMAGKTDAQIIESAARPNGNVDKLLEAFEEWLRGN